MLWAPQHICMRHARKKLFVPDDTRLYQSQQFKKIRRVYGKRDL